MKPVLILSLLLVCNLFAGGPIVLVDNETITSDTTYKIPLVPYDGSFNTLRVVIKANSNKPEGSERITNHPLKIGSITFHLNGNELKFDSVKDLPLLGWSIKSSIKVERMQKNVIRIKFSEEPSTSYLDINPKGSIKLIKKEKK